MPVDILQKRIRSLRRELKISQEQLSQDLGLARTAVSAYEVGRNVPSAEVIEKMAKIFGCDIGYLMGETEVKNALGEARSVFDARGGVYYHLAKSAKDLDLSEKDINLILDIIKTYKKDE